MFTGSCHCGSVRFRVDARVTEVTTCDCSLCVKRNAVMVKVAEKELTVLEGEAILTLYAWNTGVAKHYFCRRCGIYVFHRKRSAPDHFGVNVFCLEAFDPRSVPVRATEGAAVSVKDGNSRIKAP
jgi:hypothetical protein